MMICGWLGRWGAATLVPLALSACGDRDGSTPDASFTPVTVATPAAQSGAFGTRIGGNFASVSALDNTAEPRDPTQADVPPLDPTAAPVDN